MAGLVIPNTEEAPMDFAFVDRNGAKTTLIGERAHNVYMIAKGAYANEVNFVDSVRAWLEAGLDAEW